MQTIAQRRCWLAHAELALARGDPVIALQIADALTRSDPTASTPRPIATLLVLRGDALAAQGRRLEAEAALRAAAVDAAERGPWGLQWRIDLSLGILLRREARHEDAEQQLASARSRLAELADRMPDTLREGVLRAGAALIPPPRAPSPRAAAKQAAGGLTERECEVAARVARGLSNRAIAHELVLAERTVETYVAHIFDKLGFSSRAQLATWATEHGIAARAGD
jgi:DNA-binding CsgD family transcriptional regulator